MPIIDKKTFEALKQMSGEDFIGELIDAFLDDGPNILDAMRAALEAKDVETFRRNAHSLKSNANTFGALELGELAKELESMARNNNLEIGSSLEVLEEAYEKAAGELAALK
jgi:HPt (histidine-containing phosphotransfer) domain-containing protein